MRLLPVVSVSLGTRTTPYGSSYGLTPRSLRTTPRPISGWFASWSLLRVSGPGSFRIDALLPALAFPVAFHATVPALRDGFTLPVLIALTHPVSGESKVAVGITSVPSSLISSAASILRRLASSSMPTGPISLRVQHPAVGVRACRPMSNGRIHTILFDSPSSGHLCK